jgi:hypothetical protein
MTDGVLSSFGESVEDLVSGSWNYLRGAGPRDNLGALEAAYVQKKPSLHASVQRRVEECVAYMRSDRQRGSGREDKASSGSSFCEELIKGVLLLPTRISPIAYNESDFDQMLSPYAHMGNGEAVVQIKRFARNLVYASGLEHPGFRSPLYFSGDTGTGKTEAARTIAKTLGLPIIEIKLAKIDHLSDLIGRRGDNASHLPSRPGLLFEKLIELGKQGYNSKNVIVFFDEAEKLLNMLENGGGKRSGFETFMLELLDGTAERIESPYFGGEIDIRHWGIVLAGNQRLEAEHLQSRVETVEFGAYSVDYYKQVTRERFVPALIKDYERDLGLDDLTAGDYAELDAMVEQLYAQSEQKHKALDFKELQRRIKNFLFAKASALPKSK